MKEMAASWWTMTEMLAAVTLSGDEGKVTSSLT